MSGGPPKRGTAVPKSGKNGANSATERWVPVEGKPHLWRDVNSHPDPAHQRMKYTPPTPTINPWTFAPGYCV